MVRKVFLVSDMHCPNCAMRIEGIEDDLPGVRQALASYPKGQVEVEFDEQLINELEIIAAIKKAGYTATTK